MDKLEEIINDLTILIENSDTDYESKNYNSYKRYLDEFNKLLSDCHSLSIANDLKEIGHVPQRHRGAYGGISRAEIAKHREVIGDAKKLLHRVESKVSPKKEKKEQDALGTLELLFSKFHSVVRQLRNRHDNRVTLDVNDEYDVQDLLHALLRIYFDDIRPEEWTPSYAGGSNRMDFILKKEKVVIEVKKTRGGLADKEVGEQLLIDIEKYKEHQDCKTLLCFVYDPEGRIGNPVGLENDLAKQSRKGLFVKVFVYPK